METSTSNAKKGRQRALYIVGAAALIIAIAVAQRWQKSPSKEAEGTRFTAGTPDSAQLSLEDSQPRGAVAVAAAELPRPGYVVVQEELFGQPGIIVGASDYIQSGRIEKLTVALTRAFSGGEKFYVSVRADNGDGRFKQIDDLIMTDAAGSPVEAMVTVYGTGSEENDIALPESVQAE